MKIHFCVFTDAIGAHLKPAMTSMYNIGVVDLAYYAPQTLQGANSLADVEALVASDLGKALQTFLNIPDLSDRELKVDAFPLPVDEDSITRPGNLDRLKYRFWELVANADLALSSHIVVSASPGDDGPIRFSPPMSCLVASPWVTVLSLHAALIANFVVGMVVQVEIGGNSVIECVIDEIDEPRLRLSNLEPGLQGATAQIVGAIVPDPYRIVRMHTFQVWRSEMNGVAFDAVDADSATPSVRLLEGVVRGHVAIRGSDARGSLAIVVRRDDGVFGKVAGPGGFDLMEITFVVPFPTDPVVVVHAANAGSAPLDGATYCRSNHQGFTLGFAPGKLLPGDGDVLVWNYQVGGAGAEDTGDPRGSSVPSSMLDFNERLYRLLYEPIDPGLNIMTMDEVRANFLAHPERVSSVRDIALRTTRSFDVTHIATSLSFAAGACIAFEAPHGGSIVGMVTEDRMYTVPTRYGDRLVPTFATVQGMIASTAADSVGRIVCTSLTTGSGAITCGAISCDSISASGAIRGDHIASGGDIEIVSDAPARSLTFAHDGHTDAWISHLRSPDGTGVLEIGADSRSGDRDLVAVSCQLEARGGIDALTSSIETTGTVRSGQLYAGAISVNTLQVDGRLDAGITHTGHLVTPIGEIGELTATGQILAQSGIDAGSAGIVSTGPVSCGHVDASSLTVGSLTVSGVTRADATFVASLDADDGAITTRGDLRARTATFEDVSAGAATISSVHANSSDIAASVSDTIRVRDELVCEGPAHVESIDCGDGAMSTRGGLTAGSVLVDGDVTISAATERRIAFGDDARGSEIRYSMQGAPVLELSTFDAQSPDGQTDASIRVRGHDAVVLEAGEEVRVETDLRVCGSLDVSTVDDTPIASGGVNSTRVSLDEVPMIYRGAFDVPVVAQGDLAHVIVLDGSSMGLPNASFFSGKLAAYMCIESGYVVTSVDVVGAYDTRNHLTTEIGNELKTSYINTDGSGSACDFSIKKSGGVLLDPDGGTAFISTDGRFANFEITRCDTPGRLNWTFTNGLFPAQGGTFY